MNGDNNQAIDPLYGVETGALVRAVKRHIDRFPADFMFQLTEDEFRVFITELEQKYDKQFKAVFDAIRVLMTSPEPKTRRIGFASDKDI